MDGIPSTLRGILMAKVCKRCSREYEDQEGWKTPAEELGQIFLEDTNDQLADVICPECMEELGILTLLGFLERGMSYGLLNVINYLTKY